MLPRQIASALPLRSAISIARRSALVQHRSLHARVPAPAGSEYPQLTETEDPGQNGGYVNPPRVKRQFRDPYGDWWDKQERRNYGEPVHEDNDILGMFTPEEYTHSTPGKAALQVGAFILVVCGLLTAVKLTYPDRPSAPKEYEGGLEAELGGPGAVRARAGGDE
ncbi:hypothetical protein BJ878DRAFT_486213 [Calycina marina]|uniref:Uncharacterized protein n=1 Tax=Calycina marina TaxID=1763456 RepID=A0A9P8CIW2_9HELO|nr:hypothetical protein BJ878DRAFT_486213 [Calycina marina]